MPLFEYECSDCGAEFEKIVSTHKTAVVCQRCESPRVEKKLSVFAVSGATNDVYTESGCGACGADEPGMCRM